MRKTSSSLFALCAVGLLGAATGWLGGASSPAAGPGAADPDAGYKQIFRRLDADGDGAVTEKEYTSRSRWPAEQAGKIWRASDADGDGKVTEAEYCRNRRVTDKAKEVFAWIDADKDGKLTEPEAVAAAKRIFLEMDKDRSGDVTTPEYLSTRWEWDVEVNFLKVPRTRKQAK
ncbi:MAG TPA: hypothetical protein VM695_00235 [Phycisphaerae bacterium]|nr:hypothetical protein [Phycisphaerae bacterium]